MASFATFSRLLHQLLSHTHARSGVKQSVFVYVSVNCLSSQKKESHDVLD